MRIKRRLLDGLFNTLDLSLLETVTESQAREQITKATIELLQDHEFPMTADTRKRLLKEVCDEILGLVITSYSIHYTKLYEVAGQERSRWVAPRWPIF